MFYDCTLKKRYANTDQSMSNLSCSNPWLFKPMENNKSNKSEMLNKTLLTLDPFQF